MSFQSSEDRNKFQHLCDSYGGDILAWPAEHRDWAFGISSVSDEAVNMLETARELDALLAEVANPQPSPALKAAILMDHSKSDELNWWPFRSIWQPFAGMAVALALGVLVGVISPPIFNPVNGVTAESVMDELTFGDAAYGEVAI